MLAPPSRFSPLALALLFWATVVLAAPQVRAEFRFGEPVDNGEDVFLWPINIHLGFGYTGDGAHGAGGVSLGVDLATFSWKGLVAEAFTFRMVLRSDCPRSGAPPEGGSCGLDADMFLGSRLALALYPDAGHQHQISLGAGIGWGSIGSGLSNDLDQGSGFLVTMPTFRYAWGGILGLEVQSILPMVSSYGERYPATFMVNLVGGAVIFAPFVR